MFPHALEAEILLSARQFLALAHATGTPGLPRVLCPRGTMRVAPDSSSVLIDFTRDEARAALQYLGTVHSDCHDPSNCEALDAVIGLRRLLVTFIDLAPACPSVN